jgi:tetratricopeptide (TPR) repeat protein
VVEYRNAIRIAPDFAMAHANFGLALLNQDRPDEAIAELKKAVRLDPELAEAYYNMGIAYNKKGLIPEAIKAYEGFLQHAPERFGNYVEGVKKIVAQLKLKVAGNS